MAEEKKKQISLHNIVEREPLKEVQLETLKLISDAVMKTAGPFGSYTMIMNEKSPVVYSKDGHKVLQSIKFWDPLQQFIQQELVEITQYIVNKVGDGTTTATRMSYLIFRRLLQLQKSSNYPMHYIITEFQNAIKMIQDNIKANADFITDDNLEPIRDICMISTNGNTEVSNYIYDIYNKYGTGVFIDVKISNTTDFILKEYDGVTLERGYPHPAYINTDEGTCEIRNPRIYCFNDPVDTPEMMSFFNRIIDNNIITPIAKREAPIPTVILVPSISRDMQPTLEELEGYLCQFDNTNKRGNKPPFVIIPGLNDDFDYYSDIVKLCGCPYISKYIDPEVQKKDIEDGKAPDIDTILNWYGTTDLIVVDNLKTKFINPKHMFERNEDGSIVTGEDGSFVKSKIYEGLIYYIEKELEVSEANNEDIKIINSLKKRLNALRANMVELLVGGITIADRDAIRDVVEDAVLACRSAARNGYGYGASFEGLLSSRDLMIYIETNCDINTNKLLYMCIKCIEESYEDMIRDLYRTKYMDEDVDRKFNESLEKMEPINLVSGEFDGKVLASADTDYYILDAISRIVTLMFQSNQALLISPQQNKYINI